MNTKEDVFFELILTQTENLLRRKIYTIASYELLKQVYEGNSKHTAARTWYVFLRPKLSLPYLFDYLFV